MRQVNAKDFGSDLDHYLELVQSEPIVIARAPCADPWRNLGGLSRLPNSQKGVGHVETQVVVCAD